MSASPRDPAPSPRRGALRVGGKPYSNAAAKFWMTFIDGVLDACPLCTLATISAPAASALKPDQLFPERELARQLESAAVVDLDAALRETIAELELLGPPCAVRVRLYGKDSSVLIDNWPLDCLDAELLPYMVVWLLEWAGIPPALWNYENVTGELEGEDRSRFLTYSFSYNLHHRHVSEGLYERTLSLSFSLMALA